MFSTHIIYLTMFFYLIHARMHTQRSFDASGEKLQRQ